MKENAFLEKTPSTTIFVRLGVILIGVIGATVIITFVAANWGVIPKVWKLILLFSSLWLAYGLAYWLPAWRGLFLFLGTFLFGTNIWLIAQMYHIELLYPSALLIWSLSALLVAVLLKDISNLILGVILGTLWTVFLFI